MLDGVMLLWFVLTAAAFNLRRIHKLQQSAA